MAKSFGEALANGVPIILTRAGACPEVICEKGRELQALETMEKMSLIKLVRPIHHIPSKLAAKKEKYLLTTKGN